MRKPRISHSKLDRLHRITQKATHQIPGYYGQFDITNLFTNVPTSETLHITRKGLLNDNSLPHRTDMKIDAIMELTTICLQSTYFQYNEEFYEQTDGLAMGSPLSPILVDIFMKDFEERSLSSTLRKPNFYRCYVDDTFVIWP
ncbi:uncharacterized protein LOC143236466 [Tachypleus tridentatus]|uniref:uncharacterized protein LOC143236466 n=1 Tax=Tachypleus tridentatus TaxID=6853 RepID=UPI003FCFCD21